MQTMFEEIFKRNADFDEREKRYRRREGIQSEAYFSALADDFDELRQSQRLTQSEPAVQGRSERRTKTQSVIRGGGEVYTTDAQFLGAMPQYESMSDFLKDIIKDLKNGDYSALSFEVKVRFINFCTCYAKIAKSGMYFCSLK